MPPFASPIFATILGIALQQVYSALVGIESRQLHSCLLQLKGFCMRGPNKVTSLLSDPGVYVNNVHVSVQVEYMWRGYVIVYVEYMWSIC